MANDRIPGPGEVPKAPERRRAQRVLRMVSELHKQGYQRLRGMPQISAKGTF